jgi:hypothetical protein
MSFSVVSGLFYGYFKLKNLELLYNKLEKKLRYIEYALDVNDNYRTHHDKNHSLILERIRILEHIISNTSLNHLQKQSPKNNLILVTNNTFIDCDINDTNDTNDTNSDDIDTPILSQVPRVKSDIEIEMDAEIDYTVDFYNNNNQNDNLIVKRSSNSFLDLTKKMIFG